MLVRRRAGARFVAPVLVALLLAGCSGDETDPAAVPAPDDGDPDAAADDDEADGQADAGSATPANPVSVDLDLEQRTSTGTVFRVQGLEVDDLSIRVDVEVIVAADQGNVTLNSPIGGTAATIRDDQGGEYPLIPPEDNRNLTLDPGERLEGTLVYQGPLQDGTQELTLHFNHDSDPEGTGLTSRMYPHFTFGPIDIAG